ncbi:MAG: ATP-binding protein [Ruminococcus sp.]|nr:ATP-binding protein [Ruminococcus sp.]
MLDNKLNFKYDSVNTGNRVVDIVSNTKLMQCRNEDISVIVCSSKFETDIKDVDMCSLLGNIFDNAIEACRKVEKNREIYFEITQQKKYIHIILKNSIKKSVLESNPELKTTKVQKKIHGYGLKSVRDIVNKYNGMIEIYEKNGLFIMDIWIPSEGF